MPRVPLVASPRALTLRAAAAILIAIGYLDLIRGGAVIAPLALVTGYIVLVPLALLAE
ncbi:MAG TPA: hypothetical protein VKA54_14355 [Gemmatimonadaceae bacterium]|nr:hypothetical protein [Gemmatimonadaceae bacterium]